MKVVVGLGNPGSVYENTRHNAGFMVLDALAQMHSLEFRDSKPLLCQYAKGRCADQDLVLVKPMTYMNLSGRCVQSVLSWFKCQSQEMIVLHDDVSLNLGRLRFQKDGGAGGQHGVESIIEALGGSKQFDRLKIGVGPDPGGARRADYVLGKLPQAERQIFELVTKAALDGLSLWLSCGVQAAANKFNGEIYWQEVKPG